LAIFFFKEKKLVLSELPKKKSKKKKTKKKKSHPIFSERETTKFVDLKINKITLMLPPLRAVYTRILLRRMYYGHSGIRINTAFVSALLESNLLSLRFFLFFFRNFSGGFVNFAQRMFLTERNSGVPTFFWTFSEFSQKRNRLAFALYFFSPICRRFSIPIHAKRKFCVLKIP